PRRNGIALKVQRRNDGATLASVRKAEARGIGQPRRGDSVHHDAGDASLHFALESVAKRADCSPAVKPLARQTRRHPHPDDAWEVFGTTPPAPFLRARNER